MGYKNALFSLLFLLVSCKSNETAPAVNNKPEINSSPYVWHWESDFTESEKGKIQKYIIAVSEATFKVLGNYPFKVHYYFERSDNKNEPIPWAHTERSKSIQGVRFLINPDFDYEVMYADWTAPHEISHLSIPFLGRENAWFAEGYASYMQYQIMQEMGVYSKEEVAQRYQKKIENIQDDYSKKLPFTESAKALKGEYNYPAMYWGGAKYFMEINNYLYVVQDSNLNELIQRYQTCCRGSDENIEMLLKSLDKISKSPIFTKLYKDCSTKPFKEIYGN